MNTRSAYLYLIISTSFKCYEILNFDSTYVTYKYISEFHLKKMKLEKTERKTEL